METYTVETCTTDDDHAPRTVRHQCTDYINAMTAFDAILPEIEQTGGAVELVQHGPDGSVRVKGMYRRAKKEEESCN